MFLSQRFVRSVLSTSQKPVSRAWRQMCQAAEEIPVKSVPNLEKSINRITLLGRVGIDPQTRGSEASPVVVFTLATNNNYRFENGDIQQKTEWHRISVFKPHLRNTVALNVKKGQRVFVDGRLVYGEIIDSAGQSQITSTIVANDVICFSKNP